MISTADTKDPVGSSDYYHGCQRGLVTYVHSWQDTDYVFFVNQIFLMDKRSCWVENFKQTTDLKISRELRFPNMYTNIHGKCMCLELHLLDI
jgi:hypothetical protein